MRVLALFALILLPIVPAHAQEPPTSDDVATVQGIIRSQLDAFNRDDGVEAWSYASPRIQAKFQSVEVFMEMVRTAYSPVYRSISAEFGEIKGSVDMVVQEVVVTGQDGTTALAVYQLGRQPDGSWKIEGVTLQRMPDLTA
jgi:hypothetical protein